MSKRDQLSDKTKKSKSEQQKQYKFGKTSLKSPMWGKNQRKNKVPSRWVGIIHKNAIITPFLLASNLKLWLYAWVLNHVMLMKFNPSHHANLNSCNPCIHQSFSSIVASSEMHEHLLVQRKNMTIDLSVLMAKNGNEYPLGWFEKSLNVGWFSS